MLHHGSVTCCVSTWLRADGAAFPNGGEGKMTVHLGTSDLVANHSPSSAETGRARLWRPDGLVEHGQALVHALALLTCNQKDTVQRFKHLYVVRSYPLLTPPLAGKIPVKVQMSRTTDTQTNILEATAWVKHGHSCRSLLHQQQQTPLQIIAV